MFEAGDRAIVEPPGFAWKLSKSERGKLDRHAGNGRMAGAALGQFANHSEHRVLNARIEHIVIGRHAAARFVHVRPRRAVAADPLQSDAATAPFAQKSFQLR